MNREQRRKKKAPDRSRFRVSRGPGWWRNETPALVAGRVAQFCECWSSWRVTRTRHMRALFCAQRNRPWQVRPVPYAPKICAT